VLLQFDHGCFRLLSIPEDFVEPFPSLHQQAQRINRWFVDLSQEDADLLLHSARRRSLKAGERICSRGDAPDGVYGIESGVVRLSGLSRDGRETVLDFYGRNTWFGEVSSLSHLGRFHDIEAHAPTTLLHIGQKELDALLARSHSLSRAFIMLAALRLGILLLAIEQYSVQPLEGRLASRLLMLDSAFGVPGDAEGRIDLHLPQETLAMLIGSTRQRVNQILRNWEELGLVRHHYGRLLLKKRQEIERLADGAFIERPAQRSRSAPAMPLIGGLSLR